MKNGKQSLWEGPDTQDSIDQKAFSDVIHCGEGCAYGVLDLVGKTAGSSLYRARSMQHGGAALLKRLESGPTAPEQRASFRREYTILQSLDVPGVVKPITLVDQSRHPVMLLQDAPGELLETVLSRDRLDWPFTLRLVCQLARMLAGLHAAHLTHHDIRPTNLLLSPEKKLYLVDLSRATRDAPQTIATGNPTVADSAYELDWAYVSPEQTGRMNRTVDYRTDFYSLGVTLYRMLTGELPLHGNDALEWAHSHIARMPRPPVELCPDIPPVVSAIVMKLLAKMPQERYQSARGLLHDLQSCVVQWDAHGAVAPFDLGTQDWSAHLQISNRLVGRESEMQQLQGALDAMVASGHAALLLVSGSAGVGKSALVREMHRPVMDRHGYFISGKFDQFKRDIPYATVTQAFSELVPQILTESDERIAAWRAQIQAAVDASGQLIIDVLPQVELIIGAQAPTLELPPAEAQNRFRILFEKFICVFAQQEHPLTLFLDDLQWADADSLQLVGELLTSTESRCLLVVGAYRDNEVSGAGPTHPLTVALDDMRSGGATMTQIALAPLSEEVLHTFINEVLQREPDATAPLAHLIYQRTAGNPFFMVQFISALADEGMIAFDAGAKVWRWDLNRIMTKGYTDNVADLLIYKLARLPEPAQAVLQCLACLGSNAQEALLALVCGQPEAGMQAALSEGINAGLLWRADGTVSFLHDRVQEAAYLSIPASSRTARHVQIGRLLIAGKTQAQIEEDIFAIVSQFNRGADALTDPGDKALLCHLNFLAGKKSKAAIAYTLAREFLDRAFGLLPGDAWQAQYNETFTLTLALSECEYLLGNFERADQLINLALAHTQSHVESARVYQLRMQLYQMTGRYDDTVRTLFEVMRLFNVVFPAAGPEIEAAIDAEIRDISVCLQGRRIADIADAPQLTDADMGAVIALLMEAAPAAYITDTRPDYFALIAVKAMLLSLRHGHTEASCLAYSNYGAVLQARRGDIATAFEFSELALKLNEKLGGRRLKGRLLLAHCLAFSAWEDPIASVTPTLELAFTASLEVGDLLAASYIAFYYFWPMLQQGLPLDVVSDMARRHANFVRDSHHDMVYQAIRLQQQLVTNLQRQTRGPASLDDGDFDEAKCLDALEKAGFGAGLYFSYIAKQIGAFTHGDYASALAAAQQASLKSNLSGTIMLVDAAHHFYLALTLAALYPQASDADQKKFAGMLAAELERHRLWAEHCPQNFLNCYALVGAEIARIEGRASDAERLYEQAIHCARDNGFIQNEAIACELASKFYRERGFEFIADTYLREARARYLRWGAESIVEQLDARYPQLRERSAAAPLDVLSVTKASQAISSRVVLDDLADMLLRIVLENAGAQTASLLLSGSQGLVIAAQANVDQAAVQVRIGARLTPAEVLLPAAILNYVRRSQELVLLPDVTQPNRFSADTYFASHHPKSVLCLPVLRQDVLIGLLYLENHLVTHAFSPQRVVVLQLLACQAAISLENVRLYADLKQEIEARKRAEQTAQQLAAIVTSSEDAIVGKTLDGTITSWNAGAERMYGYSESEMIGRSILTLIPPELSDEIPGILARLRRGERVEHLESVRVHKDGRRIDVSLTVSPIRDPDGKVIGSSAIARDISGRKRAEQALREGEQKYRLLWETTTDAVILMDQNSCIQFANPSVAIVFGYPPKTLIGQNIAILQPERLRETHRRGVQRYLETGVKKLDWRHTEIVALHQDGHEFPAEISFSQIESGGPLLFAGFMRDISERKRTEQALREKEARIRRLVDANIIGVIFWDIGGGVLEANDAFLQLIGYSRQDLVAGNIRWTDMTPAQYRALDARVVEELMSTGACKPYEKEIIRKDGQRVPVLISGALFEGSRTQGLSFVLDLSERKQMEDRMRHMADHDALTGLPNRALLQDRMQQAIAYAQRNQRRVAVLFIDLDYFKNINDSLGHHFGDVVLQMTAQRLQNCLREGDSVGRLGGDEFVLILPLLGDSSDAARVAQKALDVLAQSFIVEGHELHVSASIGISLYPDDGADVEVLMRTADTAMYHAKQSGRGNFQFFTPAIDQAARQRLDIGARLHHALIQDEFIMHYQPQVDMQSGTIFSAEALLRWQPPGTEPISCSDFIANAEESGLIVSIGEWALRQACQQLKIWRDGAFPDMKMAVNLSPRQLELVDFCKLVRQILDETGIPAGALELEITEGILLQRNEATLATLTQLGGMGIQITVDDFGTGYSNLSYLQRFPVHALKIDQSFVRAIGTDAKDTALVTAIISMANSLELKVIAEGVETLPQAQFLMAHGSLTGQGFYYSQAVPAQTLSQWLRKKLPLPSSDLRGAHWGAETSNIST